MSLLTQANFKNTQIIAPRNLNHFGLIIVKRRALLNPYKIKYMYNYASIITGHLIRITKVQQYLFGGINSKVGKNAFREI